MSIFPVIKPTSGDRRGFLLCKHTFVESFVINLILIQQYTRSCTLLISLSFNLVVI